MRKQQRKSRKRQKKMRRIRRIACLMGGILLAAVLFIAGKAIWGKDDVTTEPPTAQATAALLDGSFTSPSPESAALASASVSGEDQQRIEAAVASVSSVAVPETKKGFLPVFHRVQTDEKLVAITIDDCYQPSNLVAMVNLISAVGGKATIFPIGKNLEMNSLTLKRAWESGFEIENHTWGHSGLYNLDDEPFTRQISRQSAGVSELLGVEYQMHFLRPRGGDNRYDQRTHAYLKQLGYYGIALWSQNGTSGPVDELMEHVQSGDIFLFHTTDYDLSQMQELVARLTEEGYRLVTLNEMFDLPQNETSQLLEHTAPEPLKDYVHMDQTYREEDYLHDVYLIQEKLTELGFLKTEYNGYYGKATAAAVKAYQQSVGLKGTGICDPATWNRLFEP